MTVTNANNNKLNISKPNEFNILKKKFNEKTGNETTDHELINRALSLLEMALDLKDDESFAVINNKTKSFQKINFAS